MRRLAVAATLAIACASTACSSYVGTAKPFSPAALARDPRWIAVRDVPPLRQQSESDCGAAAIGMVVAYWTGAPAEHVAAALRPAPARGIKAGRLRELAVRHGLASFLIRGELSDLEHELSLGRPVLVGLIKPHRRSSLAHYEVVVAIHPVDRIIVTLDPDLGWRQNSFDGFLAEWQPADRLTLIVTR